MIQPVLPFSITPISPTRLAVLSILLGAALGLLSPARAQFTGPNTVSPPCTACSPTDVHAADLSGNGNDDVIVAAADDGKIAWYRNTGSGFADQQQVIRTGLFGIEDIYTADLDGDGNSDVLAAIPGAGSIVWYKNLGSGDFSSTPNTIPTGVTNPQVVHAANLDGDSGPDVVTASSSSSGEVVWAENDGSGNFSSGATKISSNVGNVRALTVADVKGEGNHPDIITGGDSLRTIQGNGSGAFDSEDAVPQISDVYALHASDLNPDSTPEVLYSDSGGVHLGWFNKSSGPEGIASGFGTVVSLFAADVDTAGYRDIVYADQTNGKVGWVSVGSDPAPFGFSNKLVISAAPSVQAVSATGVDGDDDADALSASLNDEVAWYESRVNEGENFESGVAINSVPPVNGPQALATADLTGNGRPDVLSISEDDRSVSWFENKTAGDGGFAVDTITTLPTGNSGFADVHAADLSGDGTPDALAAGGANSSQGGGVFWNKYSGSGDGFSATRKQIFAPQGNPYSAVHATDLNEDDSMDVVAVSAGEGTLFWSLNGDGTFQSSPPNTKSGLSSPKSVYPADVDGDANPDLIAALRGSNEVVWFENQIDGDGGFSSKTVIASGVTNVQDVHAADLDGDGDPDVLSVSPDDGEVVAYENTESGFLAPRVLTTDLNGANIVRTADLDDDGDPDVVARAPGAVVAYRNGLDDGTGFSSLGAIPTTQNPTAFATSVALADVDADGAPDVLTSSSTLDGIDWFKNWFKNDVSPSSPNITLSGPDTPPSPGENTSVSVTFPDGFTPSSATLFYGSAPAGEFQSTGLDLASLSSEDRTVSAQIPGSVVTEGGVRYYLRTGGYTIPSTAPVDAAYLPVRLSDVAAAGAFQAQTYRMLTVPVAFEDRSAFEALKQQYGAYNAADWRLGRWSAPAGEYRFGPNVTPLAPGEAAWLITAGGELLTFPEAQSPDVTGPQPITLDPGWNQIGSPFRFPVAWASVQKPASVRAPVAYDPSRPKGDRFQFGAATLEPWDGVFVYNGAGEAVTIKVPPVGAGSATEVPAAKQSPTAKTPSGYRLRAIATLHRNGKRLQDRNTGLGFADGSTEGFGPKDLAKPPAVGAHVRLYAMPSSGPGLARSLRPTPEDGAAWNLRLRLALDGNRRSTETVTVQLAEQGARPDGFQRYVIDRDRGTRLPITNQSVQVPVKPNESTRRLRVMVGTEAFAKTHSGDASLAIEETALLPNAPNPFSASTTLSYQLAEKQPVTIAVYDLLGRRVTTLVDGPRPSGVHQIEWQAGRGQSSLSSGVYICRMQAGSYTGSQKLVLVR